MGKNLAATCSKLIKWGRSYQTYFLTCVTWQTLNLFFIQVNLLKVKTCLNRRLFMKAICLWQKIARYDSPHLFKTYWDFSELYCEVPQVWDEWTLTKCPTCFLILFTFEQNNSCLTKFFIQSFSKIVIPLVQTQAYQERRRGRGYILLFPTVFLS